MRCFCLIACPLTWLAAVSVLSAADRRQDKPMPEGEVVEIFAAIEKGQIEARLIPKDSSKCRLLVTNQTDRPLNVVLPQAFAGVPVLAQPGIGLPNQNARQGNRPQAIGIGPGIRGPGQMNLRGRNVGGPNIGPNLGPNLMPGPLFNVAPEKVGKLKLTSVCLDYGKPEPGPRVKYEIKPIDDHTRKPGVAEVCVMLGRGEIPQRVAQLAAWHLSNDKTWGELAAIRHRVTFGTQPTYSPKELKAAEQAAEKAVELAGKRGRPDADKSDSLSRK